MWPKFGDPSGQLVSSLTVCSLLLLLSLGWLVGDAYGAVVERRATLQQARCVAACLEQYVAGSSLDVQSSCNLVPACSQCTTFCLADGTRFRLTDQSTCRMECGTGSFCSVACSFFMSSDVPRDAPSSAPLAKWNTSGQHILLTWQPSILIPTDVYLICLSSAVPCDISVSNLVYYLVIGKATGNVAGSSASIGSLLRVAQVSSAGTMGFSMTSLILPGVVSGIGVSRSFYSTSRRRTFVNITWSHPPDDGYVGQRRFNVLIEHEDTSIPRGNDACTRRIQMITQTNHLMAVLLGGGLEHNCEYDITIAPLLTSGYYVNSSATVLRNYTIRGNIEPPPVPDVDLCQYYNFRRDFNLSVSSGPVGSRGVTVTWGWWSFNRTLPLYDFVSSMGPFSIVLMDYGLSFLFPRLEVGGINPISVDNDNTIATFLNITVDEGARYVAFITFHLYTSRPLGDGPRARYEAICTSPEAAFTPKALQTTGGSTRPAPPLSTLSPSTSPGNTTQRLDNESDTLLTTIVAPVAASLGLALVVVLVVCFQCRKSKKPIGSPMMPVTVDTSMGTSDMTGSTDIFPASITPDGPGDIVRPLPDVWEVPRENVHLLEQLGRGAFGQVNRAQLDDPPRLGVDRAEVAVKKLFDTANNHDKTDLLEEILRMKDIAASGGHRHLVRFAGCCTQDDPIYLISECIAHGSLKDLMQRTRQAIPTDPYLNTLEAQGMPRIALADGHIHPAEACDFARQIAEGMAFLAHMRMIHRDLAARNILVDRGKVLKVSDFGMTRDVYEDPDEVYIKTTGGKVPIRWMSLEALTLRTYSTESDMWSFGVLLWEIATLAKFPYSGIQNRELISELRGGRRMEKPRGCPDDLYEIMLQCWNEEPERRPRFSGIAKIFEELPQKLEAKKKSRRPSLKSMRPYSFPRIANLRNNLRNQPPPEPAPAAPSVQPGSSPRRTVM